MADQEKAHEALEKAVEAVLDGAPVEQERANYLKTMRAATRLKFSLVADTIIKKDVKKWRKAFDDGIHAKELPERVEIKPRKRRRG